MTPLLLGAIALGTIAVLGFTASDVAAAALSSGEGAPPAGDPLGDPIDNPTPDVSASSAPPTDPAPRFTGAAAAIPLEQQYTIVEVASEYSIDARLLAAIHLAENGPILGDGTRGCGVIAPPEAKRDFRTNAQWAAGTIQKTLGRYRINIGEPLLADGRVSGGFLSYLAYGGKGYTGFAPLGAANDPTNLNINELGNVTRYYWSSDSAVA